ncbi:hypothetical protein AK812_SmicGene10409 [Symbiodinium microadriaticum]|uniref:Uncharacterized protein n=1 Tax=Symbiodinium microadriaticum TaxID=2951 RepID=A0A1Q9EFT7_SYMMI|nr:hypothetical protein AK812_SmicGene10409 [Symbiodinium microadriaticum]
MVEVHQQEDRVVLVDLSVVAFWTTVAHWPSPSGETLKMPVTIRSQVAVHPMSTELGNRMQTQSPNMDDGKTYRVGLISKIVQDVMVERVESGRQEHSAVDDVAGDAGDDNTDDEDDVGDRDDDFCGGDCDEHGMKTMLVMMMTVRMRMAMMLMMTVVMMPVIVRETTVTRSEGPLYYSDTFRQFWSSSRPRFR